MNGINLIPVSRVQSRRRATRVRVWASILPAVASALLGGYGWLRTTWPTESATLIDEIAQLDAGIAQAEAGIARARAQTSQQEIILRAHRAVGEQPDWGVLLYRLSQHVGERIVFTGCVLEPLQSSGSGGRERPGGRPDRFKLILHGMGREQADVSGFVIALEGEQEPRLFDSVTLMESRRVPLGGKDAVSFRIECAMTDSTAEAR